MALEQEEATYRRLLPTFLASSGKYVVIHKDEVEGVYDTYNDALKVGYAKFGLEPFFIKQIEGVERTNRFTRDISTCPT